MTALAPDIARPSVSLGADAGAVGRTLLVGTAAGALAGIVVGGIGGRLVMLALRLFSDPIVLGAISDDGFEIGRFTLGGTVQLLGATAALGAANGALYAILREALPSRARAALWSCFAAALGGSQFVHSDGVDFTLLEPLWLAVAAFVALPGLAALAVVLLVERWLSDDVSQPHPAFLAMLALSGSFARAVAAMLGSAVLAARRLGVSSAVARAGRLLVPTGIVIGTVVAGWYTAVEATQILG